MNRTQVKGTGEPPKFKQKYPPWESNLGNIALRTKNVEGGIESKPFFSCALRPRHPRFELHHHLSPWNSQFNCGWRIFISGILSIISLIAT